MAQVKFFTGTRSEYLSLSSYDNNALYFLTDTLEIYRGSKLYTSCYEVVEDTSSIAPKENYLYFIKNGNYVAIYEASANGGQGGYINLTPPQPTIVQDLKSSTNDSADIPSVAAVKNAIALFESLIPDSGDEDKSVREIVQEELKDYVGTSEDGTAKPIETIVAETIKEDLGIAEEDANKSLREIAAEEVAKIVSDNDDAIDTLEEIANWIINDTSGAAKMANDIADLQDKIDSDKTTSSLDARISALEETVGSDEVDGTLAERLTAVESDLEKVIDGNGQENTIEIVKVAGTALTVGEDKSVNISILSQDKDSGVANGTISINGIVYTVANLGNYLTTLKADGKYVASAAYATDLQTIYDRIQESYNYVDGQIEAMNSKIENATTVTWESI